jgi:hypothetical protein
MVQKFEGPVPPTSNLSGPFSEQTFASAHLGGRIGIKMMTQNFEHSLGKR